MKSNRLLIATLATVALTFGACSDSIETPVESGDGFVTFTAELPDGVNSRAFSDGEKAKTLKYAVYESGTKTIIYSSNDADAPNAQYGNKKFTLSLPLVKGQTYDLIFWAETEASEDFTSPYTFSPTDQTVTISYTGIKCNEEARDAFFSAEKGLLVTGAMQKDIQLYRPFAQLNIGTNDIEAAKKAKIEPGTTSVTINDVYSKLDLFTGVASDASEVEFGHAVLPTGEDFPVEATPAYDYLSMNYVLTGSVILDGDVNQAQKETKDITIAIKDKTGKDVNSFNLSAVPFQRNYRTNIYGALLTSTVDYTIEIVPDYNKPDNGFEDVTADNVKVNGKEYKSITEALEAAEGTSAVLSLGAGEYTLPASLKAGGTLSSVTIEGPATAVVAFPTENNSIDAEGMDVTFKGITYSTSNFTNAAFNGIKAKSETYDNVTFVDGTLTPMSAKLTITNSNFTVNPEAGLNDQVKYALSFRNSNIACEAKISNTVFNTHMGTAVTAYHSKTDITFDNCQFVNKFNGDELKDAQSCIVYANADKTRYTHTLTMNNCTESGFLGHFLSDSKLWACKSGELVKVTIDGVEQTQPIVSTVDKKNYTLYTPSALTLMANMVNEGYWRDGKMSFENFSGKIVQLGANIDMAGVDYTPCGNVLGYPTTTFCGTFDGCNYTIANLTASSEGKEGFASAGLFGSSVGPIKNVTLTNVNITSTHYAGAVCGFSSTNTGFSIENCHVDGGTITSKAELIGESWDNGDKVGGIIGYTVIGDEVKGCSVKNITVQGYRDLGGLVGYSGGATITGNTVEDVTILVDNSHNYKNYTTLGTGGNDAGKIIGEISVTGHDSDNTPTNVTIKEL